MLEWIDAKSKGLRTTGIQAIGVDLVDLRRRPPNLKCRRERSFFSPRFLWMPRYFFNIHYDEANLDTVGEELPDDEAAWREATTITGEIVRELGDRFRPARQWRLEVVDEAGELLYVIWLTGQRAK